MAAGSAFEVPVGELLRSRRGPGRVRRVRVEAPVDWGVEYSVALPDPPLVADVELSAVSGGVHVRGSAEVTMRSTCARCLADTDQVYTVAVDQLVGPDDGRLGGDDGYRLIGDVLDLEPIVRDELLLALPVVWRCVPACPQPPPGLGEAPGNDLNTGAPGRRSDSPFAALRDLLDSGD